MHFPKREQSVLLPNGIQETLGLGQAALVSKDNSIPKAYINYLFFDKENNFKSGGYRQVSEAALGSSRSEFGTGFEELSLEFAPQNGRNKLHKVQIANRTGGVKTAIMKYHLFK